MRCVDTSPILFFQITHHKLKMIQSDATTTHSWGDIAALADALTLMNEMSDDDRFHLRTRCESRITNALVHDILSRRVICLGMLLDGGGEELGSMWRDFLTRGFICNLAMISLHKNIKDTHARMCSEMHSTDKFETHNGCIISD